MILLPAVQVWREPTPEEVEAASRPPVDEWEMHSGFPPFTQITLPKLRKAYADNIVNELVSVQPMPSDGGFLHVLKKRMQEATAVPPSLIPTLKERVALRRRRKGKS